MRRNWPDEIESRSGANNPKGIATSSPRLRGTSYLGKTSKQNDNRNAVAAMSRWSCSVPNVFFIPFDFVLAQKQAQLLLKTHLAMMLLLIGDVLLHLFEIRLADAKVCVASLPLEVGEIASAFLQPEVGDAFQLLYPFCLRDGAPESREQMHVDFHSPGEDGRTIEWFRDRRDTNGARRAWVCRAEADDGLSWRRRDECKRRKGIVACQEDGQSRSRLTIPKDCVDQAKVGAPTPTLGWRSEGARCAGGSARVATALRLGRFLGR